MSLTPVCDEVHLDQLSRVCFTLYTRGTSWCLLRTQLTMQGWIVIGMAVHDVEDAETWQVMMMLQCEMTTGRAPDFEGRAGAEFQAMAKGRAWVAATLAAACPNCAETADDTPVSPAQKRAAAAWGEDEGSVLVAKK